LTNEELFPSNFETLFYHQFIVRFGAVIRTFIVSYVFISGHHTAASLRIHFAIKSLRDDYCGNTIISFCSTSNADDSDTSITFDTRLQVSLETYFTRRINNIEGSISHRKLVEHRWLPDINGNINGGHRAIALKKQAEPREITTGIADMLRIIDSTAGSSIFGSSFCHEQRVTLSLQLPQIRSRRKSAQLYRISVSIGNPRSSSKAPRPLIITFIRS